MEDSNPPSPAPNPAPLPSGDSTGLAPNIAAGICAVFPLVGGIIFYVLEKKDPFVRFWAMQSIFFGAAGFAFSFVMRIAAMILVHIPGIGGILAFLLSLIGLAVSLAMFAIWIITIIKAFTNKEWEIPIIGKLARKQLAGQKLF